ncbi:MAG: plastocyanin/azurin family copper-binding protein [Pseudomonadota bacterium]
MPRKQCCVDAIWIASGGAEIVQRREFSRIALMAIGIASLAGVARAAGKTHDVRMWSDGGLKYYMPDFLRVEIGDTVRFVNKSGHHNTESVPGMIPESAQPWFSEIDETFELVIEHEGVYGYKCTPHYEKGMVGLIVAGDAGVNLAAAEAVETPEQAHAMFARLFKKLKT